MAVGCTAACFLRVPPAHCDDGYEGDSCHTETPTKCTRTDYCNGKGKATSNKGSCHCECDQGYTGDTCTFQKKECMLVNGTCKLEDTQCIPPSEVGGDQMCGVRTSQLNSVPGGCGSAAINEV